MYRKTLIVAVAILVAVPFLARWGCEQGPMFDDYAKLFEAVHNEELLGNGLLETTDVDALPSPAGGEKETTEPVVIDGKPRYEHL